MKTHHQNYKLSTANSTASGSRHLVVATLLALALLAGAGSVLADYSSDVLALSPIGYWRLNETAGVLADNTGSLGNGADGTYTDTVVMNEPGPVIPGVDFGANNFSKGFGPGAGSVRTGASILNNMSAFTIMGFIRPADRVDNRIALFGQDNVVEVGFIAPGTFQLWTSTPTFLDVAYPFPSNEWHHVAAVGTGSEVRIYFDGQLATSAAAVVGDYGSSGSGFNIADAVFDSSGNQFTGAIDEVTVFDRALTEEQIQSLLDPAAASRATFNVNKYFNDSNPAEVAVTISCDTGLPLEQTKMISQGHPVEFVVVDFDDGELDCDITEATPTGYSANYESNGGLDSGNSVAACRYNSIGFGADFTCDISNSLNDVGIVVRKIWIDDNPQFSTPNYARARWNCYNTQFQAYGDDPSSFFGCDGDVCGSLSFYGADSTDSFTVFPDFDGSTWCSVEERVFESGVETSSNCGRLYVAPGQGNACTITNTRFYEGIPTLSQYGLAFLALLMLGVGLVGFRRFV
jgi:hypothetical protein